MQTDTLINHGVSLDIVAARRAVLAVFFINGFTLASWITHIPDIRTKFGLGEAALGLVLLALAVGSVAALLLVGGVIARLGSRLVTIVTSLTFCALLPFIIAVPSLPLLVAVLVLFGACNGALDVAMNTQAAAIEERYGRPIMSSFHALWSTGSLSGAAIGSLILAAEVPAQWHVLAVGVLALGGLAIALRFLLPSSIDQVGESSVFTLPTGPLFWLGLLCFLGLLAEGSMADWSAVFMREMLGSAPGLAATGFTVFSLTMAIGRFTGDTLRARIGAVQIVQICGALSALGLLIALLGGNAFVAVVGFALVGFGLANMVPVLFSAASQVPGVQTGAGIAAVSSAGYAGFLVGPPLIGFVGQATNIGVGLGLVVAACAPIAIMAGRAIRSSPSSV